MKIKLKFKKWDSSYDKLTNFFKNEIVVVVILYFLILFVFFSKAFLTQSLDGDWIRFWIPNYYFITASVKDGIFPLWQPYVYMGVPAAFHPGYVIFYPVLWIFLLGNILFNPSLSFNIFGKSLEIYLYLHLLIGAVSMYFLLRKKLSLSKVTAFFGGTIYVFSVFTITSLDGQTLLGKMLLPALVLALVNFLQYKSFFNFLLLVLANWIVYILGYPYYQVYFLYAQLALGALYGWKQFIRAGSAIGSALLLSAFVLLPQAYYYAQASRVGASSTDPLFHIRNTPFPTFLLNILIPQGIYYDSVITWGTIPAILLIIGFATIKKNKITIWAVGIFATSLVLSMGGYINIQDSLGYPPFFIDKLRSHGQILVLTFFTGTLIIASGVESSLKGMRSKMVEIFLWGVFTIGLLFLLLLPFLRPNYLIDYGNLLTVLGRVMVIFLVGLILYHFTYKFKSKVFIVLMIIITLFEYRYYHSQLKVLNLGVDYNHYFAKNSLVPEIPSEKNLFRTVFWENQFGYNSSYLRVFNSAGYDGIPYVASQDISRFPVPKNYQFSNTKYLVTTRPEILPEFRLVDKISPDEHQQETIFSTDPSTGFYTEKSKNIHYIYEIKNYLERFYVPTKVTSCDTSNCFINENPPKHVYTSTKDIDFTNPDHSKVKILVDSYSSNEIVLSINTPARAFIASSEIFDKGWKIKINNKIEKVYNVSNGFRGFIVPEGNSTVVLYYIVPYFYEGLSLSILGLLGLFLIRKFKRRLIQD